MYQIYLTPNGHTFWHKPETKSHLASSKELLDIPCLGNTIWGDLLPGDIVQCSDGLFKVAGVETTCQVCDNGKLVGLYSGVFNCPDCHGTGKVLI